MTNQIRNKINEIFGEEINKNRNLLLKKHTESNKLIKKKFIEPTNDNYELIQEFNKRKSNPDDFYKNNIKFINENNENDISPKSKKRRIFINHNNKKIFKKENKEEENNYLSNKHFFVREKRKSESKKEKKIKFLIEEKKLVNAKMNDYKLGKKKSNTKKNVKNIVMIEKQKYPKKESYFDRVNSGIKDSNKENNNEDNISIKKRHKKSAFLKPKKELTKSIKALDIKYKSNDIVKAQSKSNKSNNMKEEQDEKLIEGNEDSSNYLKMNMNSSNSSGCKTIKTNKTNKTNKSKMSHKSKNNRNKEKNGSIKNSENDFFQSSKFSDESESDENDNQKDIFLIKNSKSTCKISKLPKNPLFNDNIKKSLSKKSNSNKLNISKKETEKEKKSKNNNRSSSCQSNSFEENKENENKNSENKNIIDDEDSIKKKIRYKYNLNEENVLSIIPEQDTKKIFYEDINQNSEFIKPENIITLEPNIKKDKTNNKARNIEIQKNNIIINNNISNNITVHKKESEIKKDEIKKEETNNKVNEQNKNEKSCKVKVRKKFPFCCL